MKKFIENPGVIWERMIQVLDELAFDCFPSAMAEILGISVDDFLFLNDFNEEPSLKTIVKFFKAFPDVNEEWLFEGTGLIFNPVANDNELLSHDNKKLKNIVNRQKNIIEDQNLLLVDQHELINRLNGFLKLQLITMAAEIDNKIYNSNSSLNFLNN